jgi:hypothetical protein
MAFFTDICNNSALNFSFHHGGTLIIILVIRHRNYTRAQGRRKRDCADILPFDFEHDAAHFRLMHYRLLHYFSTNTFT